MSIRGRLFLLVLIAAVPVLLLEVWSELSQRRELSEDLREEALQGAWLAAAGQDLHFENARYVLATLAEANSVLRQSSDECSTFLGRLTSKFPIYRTVVAARSGGQVFCSSDRELLGTSIADEAYFRKVLETNAFAIGDPQRDAATGDGVLGIAYPVTAAGGEMRAVLMLTLDLRRLSDSITVPQVPEGAVVTVVDGNGVVLARQPGGEEWIGRQAPDGSFVETVLEEGRGTMEAEGLDGVQRLIGFAPLIEAEGLHVAVSFPATPLFAGADALFWREVALLAVVFIVAATVAYLGGQAIIRRPLARLLSAVERLSAGDLQARSGIDSSVPEFALLGRRFDGMAGHLERREAELRRANDDLQRVNADLRGALAEKEILFKEVHHRVRNNLQVVSSLLNLQSGRFDDPALREAFRASLNRINAMGAVHQLLYESDELAELDFGALLRKLCAGLSEAYGLKPDQVALRVDAEPIRISLDAAIPLALVANELVSNALKHAFPGGRTGEIRVGFVRDGGKPVLSVTDDGVGIAAEGGAERRKGLGLVMIDNLVRQMDGTLRMEFAPGLRAEVTLPATQS